jgi:hypothetical protein
MFETANNDRAWASSDDSELRPFDGGNARPLPDAKQYVGLPNLVELAAATYLELRRESAEFNAAAQEREFKSQAERNAAKRQCYAILGRICSLERDVAAMEIAMDDATRGEFDQAIAAMPALEELVA